MTKLKNFILNIPGGQIVYNYRNILRVVISSRYLHTNDTSLQENFRRVAYLRTSKLIFYTFQHFSHNNERIFLGEGIPYRRSRGNPRPAERSGSFLYKSYRKFVF